MNTRKILTMTKTNILTLIAATILICSTCSPYDQMAPPMGYASFGVSNNIPPLGRQGSSGLPAFLLLTILDMGGQPVIMDSLLVLLPSEKGYHTDRLQFPAGQYRVAKFVIFDSAGTVAFATPLTGSNRAIVMNTALPLEFIIGSGDESYIESVIALVVPSDKPSDYGYDSLDFVYNLPEFVPINVNVELTVGDLVYNNVDATIRVRGLSEDDILQWEKTYPYVGPGLNELSVPSGFHHYDVRLDRKWGIEDSQSFSRAEIWSGRANGPSAVTYVLGGAKAPRKLSVVIVSREEQSEGGGIVYAPDSRTRYVYASDGLLQFIHHDAYDASISQFEEVSLETFTRDDLGGLKVITTLDGIPNSEFQFTGSRIQSRMTLTSNSIVTTLAVTTGNGTVSADYRSSNGTGFLYSFDLEFGNNIRDKTTVGGVLCSHGDYTFDKNINPYSHLGFIDFYLQNWSVNNMLTASVDYLSCSFPTVIPISHSFTYDEEGYPVMNVTTYRSGILINDPAEKYHSKAEYFYE